MDWNMPWYTITDSFDTDFGVNEWHGHNIFFSATATASFALTINNRGDEAMGSTWSYLDLTPLGRQEKRLATGLPPDPPYNGGTGTTNTPPPRSPTQDGLR